MGLSIPFLSLLLCMLLDCAQSQNWTHHAVLDGDGKYHLYWNLPVDKRGNNEIIFKVEVQGKGYFGLGFSPDGRLPNSDIVTGWIKDGEVYFQDRHTIGDSLPIIDNQQDYKLISAYENDSFTAFEFSRKLDTCDENDTVIDGSTMRVIYTFSEEDPESEDPFFTDEIWGMKYIIFLRKNINPDVNFTSLLKWDIRVPGIDISHSKAMYRCTIFKTPQVTKKHHVVDVKLVLEEGHEEFIIYMAWQECVGGTPEEYEKFLGKEVHECFSPDAPEEILNCQGYTLALSVGGEDVVLPEHVGLPLDPAPGKYYMLQILYENPQLVSGIIDHSGLSFYYTPDLREFDAGNFVISASLSPRAFIPPGQEEYLVVAHSSYDCLGSVFPDSGVKALAVFPHGHHTGRRIKVRHFRGNKELTPLVDDKNFSFYYMFYRFFTEEIVILPNDTITIECIYNSTERKYVTFMGYYTHDEMCLAFILYYPSVSRFLSFSSPTYVDINEVLSTNITNDDDASRILRDYDWANADINKVENFLVNAKQQVHCNFEPTQDDEANSLVSFPSDIITYELESTCKIPM